jgi:broad specificity phosphatase PhoE
MGKSLEMCLVRHGETEWSLSGAHTSRTDLPLTPRGREKAAITGAKLANRDFALVLTSPMQRARETCELAGFGDVAIVDPNLVELDYGEYEGRTTSEIQAERPGWSLWRDGCPGGESFDRAAARAGAVIARSLEADGDVVLFAHGHILRILTACWLGLRPESGRFFALYTATLSTLGFERENRVITCWNLSVSD